jgi:hypothetical protein
LSTGIFEVPEVELESLQPTRHAAAISVIKGAAFMGYGSNVIEISNHGIGV